MNSGLGLPSLSDVPQLLQYQADLVTSAQPVYSIGYLQNGTYTMLPSPDIYSFGYLADLAAAQAAATAADPSWEILP